MVGFKVNSFSGMIPSRDPRLLPENNAQIATNLFIESGALDPLNLPLLAKAGLLSTTQFVFRIPSNEEQNDDLTQPNWIEFADRHTSVYRSPIVNDVHDRFYWASPTAGLKYATQAQLIATGETAGKSVGVVRPVGRPNIDVLVGGYTPEDGELKITRAYLVTFVSIYGEESMPSNAQEARGYAGNTWRIEDIPQPVVDASRVVIDKIRIYRTETSASGATDFFEVADINPGDTEYNDTKRSIIVTGQPLLQSQQAAIPPEMKGIVLMPNGMFVGYFGHNLYFSENYLPHSWPAEYTLTVPHRIVGLGVFGTTCVVATRGNPSLLTGMTGGAMSLSTFDVSMPCISRRSVVTASDGVYFATTTGIAKFGAAGFELVTDDVIGRNLWRTRYAHNKMDGVVYRGGYIGLRPRETVMEAFWITQGSVVDILVGLAVGTTIGDPKTYCGMDVYSNKPWLIFGGNIYEWLPAGDNPRNVTWRSKVFRLPNKVTLSVAQVNADGPAIVRIYANGSLVHAQATTDDKPFRLPGGFKSDIWEVEVVSSVRVHDVIVASSIEDLKAQ